MSCHHYGDNPDETRINELRAMAREKDLEIRFFRKTNTFRIMDTQTARMVGNNISFEEAWEFVVKYSW